MQRFHRKLEEILERKKLEVKELYDSNKVFEYRMNARPRPGFNDFKAAISRPGFNLIAEYKRASPSRGDIRPDANLIDVLEIYQKAGAAAVSILTDADFKGKLDFLKEASASITIPKLRKDFIIDVTQVYESRCYGADAILLIAAALKDKQIEDLYSTANNLGMDCLVEVHNKEEVERVKDFAEIIGINNRDLYTFEEDLKTTERVIPYIPDNKIIVTESAIKSTQDIIDVYNPRINAMLVGSALMDAKDMKSETHSFVEKAKTQFQG